ncbi:LacI family DNA-binding transcriptional regulator [Paenarthrobacter aurescens]|nr:LacI family DNA-binding transcriptional regulator [Paenarthrobacter aurescens]MDO6142175.1 LacI family DNA-binding transcriptional regulator [Paenarthrobacter aurescens]MDO6146023.1 LacI family DNA-binding transcriptional regulator [Paenarthrobacter aurescens]MDO6157267.1 LacI family DNA-binding transcriptional regulator [Paenarthrobacter aurescens]MDO6161252.1 LacI family DNA-binding transcriptional regulator [Paenarthrobacter aurescens]
MGDVAKMAGVSHQTVSRVLNNHPNVSVRTKQRVESAIAQLGYRRNTAARSLVTRRSRTIGVLACETGQFGPANTLLGVEQAGREAGYFVSIANLREVTDESVNDAIAHFRNQSVDGIVILVPHPDVLAALHDVSFSVPIVAVGAGAGNQLTGASLDQRLGARLAVDHLIGLGHRRIAHISGPPHWIDAAERINGWQESLAKAGLGADVLLQGGWDAASGYRAGLDLIEQHSVTAVFVANDQMAVGVLRAVQEAGFRIPGDISVVGYDDQPEAEFFMPPLTTIKQDFEELGRRCMEAVLQQLDGDGGTGDQIVTPRLVIRATTAAPLN